MVKCQARIKREFKKARAESVWPQRVNYDRKTNAKILEDIPEHLKYPECGGELRMGISVGIDGGCGCCGTAEVSVDVYCSRCSTPYFPDMALHNLNSHYDARDYIEKVLNERLKGSEE